MELSEDSARKILKSTVDKVGYIKGSSKMQVSVGIAARRVQGRKRLESDGFRVWELDNLLEEKTVSRGHISLIRSSSGI